MAKRGFRIPIFGNKLNDRRKKNGRPYLDWAVGDDSQSHVDATFPDQYALSSAEDTDDDRYTVIDDDSRFALSESPASDGDVSNKLVSKSHHSSETKVGSTSSTSPIAPQAPNDQNEAIAQAGRKETDASISAGHLEDINIYAPAKITDSSDETSSSAEITDVDNDSTHRSVKDNGAGPHLQSPNVANKLFGPPTSPVRGRIDSGNEHDLLTDEPEHLDESVIISPPPKRNSSPSHQGLRSAYVGADANKRVDSVRLRLDNALEEWWSQSTLPPLALLRDGLLVLEAGHHLDEVHRTLLLRSSLAKRRGIVTALRYQTDPDRTAFLIKGALLDDEYAFSVADLHYLLTQFEDHASAEESHQDEWRELLLDELHHDLHQLEPHKTVIAQKAIHALENYVRDFHPPVFRGDPIYDVAVNDTLPRVLRPRPVYVSLPLPSYWNIGRVVLVFLMVAVLATTGWWLRGRTVLADMVTVPGGSYIIGEAAFGVPETFYSTDRFAIDRTEVTNESYQLCYEYGHCDTPSAVHSAIREDYFLNPDFNLYPVVNIDWESASRYCLWAGKRLPTTEEWEIAASSAPATNRHFVYPWGNTFNRLFANSAIADVGDTQAVGSYYGNGTSSVGAEDMAGNVAEWTSTKSVASSDERYLIKGGSYLDGPDQLRASAHITQEPTFSASWLGFRCAKTLDNES